MKERLLVMNGQRIVQAEKDALGRIRKSRQGGRAKPGIYNLYTAQAADKEADPRRRDRSCRRHQRVPADRQELCRARSVRFR